MSGRHAGCQAVNIRDRSYLFDEVDGRLKVEAEVDELPLDAFALILLLLQDEHLRGKEIH
jgi:hypothetical protein